MEHDGIDMAYRKYASWAVYGSPIEPELALEVIRRTDVFFASGRSFSPYQRAIRTLLDAPREEDYFRIGPDGGRSLDMNALAAALEEFQDRTGWLSWYAGDGRRRTLGLLTNAQIANGSGWCCPDGTIALAEDVKRAYPTLIWDECEAIATAFPEIEFSVAYWGRSGDEPSAGFIVRDGYVRGTSGSDPDLFGHYGEIDYLTVRKVAEGAAGIARAKLPTYSKFGARTPDRTSNLLQPVHGLPDEVLELWARRLMTVP